MWHIWAAISFERWKFLVFFCSAGHWPLAETRHFCECLKSYFKEGKKTLFSPSLTCGWFLLFFFLIYFHNTRERKDKSIRGRQENKWTVFAGGVFRISKVFHQQALVGLWCAFAISPHFRSPRSTLAFFTWGGDGENTAERKWGGNTFELSE